MEIRNIAIIAHVYHGKTTNVHVKQMKGSTKGIPILLGITLGYKK